MTEDPLARRMERLEARMDRLAETSALRDAVDRIEVRVGALEVGNARLIAFLLGSGTLGGAAGTLLTHLMGG